MPRKPTPTSCTLTALAIVLAALASGCARERRPAAVAIVWVAGRPAPAFDPQGPQEPMRWALMRLTNRTLLELDSTGRVVPGVADTIDLSPDGRSVRLRLPRDLRFHDGTACSAAAFARSIEAALSRRDHATAAWALAALRGVESVRPGRPLPRLGIETPDPHTLVFRLRRPDPHFTRALTLPSIGMAWRTNPKQAAWGVGLGDYRAIAEGARWRLVRAVTADAAAADTLLLRFVPTAGRALGMLRAGTADVVWPVPPELLEGTLPAGYVARRSTPRPPRRLVIVVRADRPPTMRAAARRVLAHGLARTEALARLTPWGRAEATWLTGAPSFEPPAFDAGAVREWLDRGNLGSSMHVGMAYDAGGVAASIASVLQEQWARLAIDVERIPMRGEKLGREQLAATGAHLLLVEHQAPFEDAASELATYVMPIREVPVGAFRSGWRTREFDRWIGPERGTAPPDVPAAQARLGEELVVLPIATLDWVWIEREGGAGLDVSPRDGPLGRAPRPRRPPVR